MKKILIIEDDPIVANIYRSRLEKESYEVEIAADGQSGFYRIYEFRPDAVLLDLMLPRMNGVEILKKIRAQSQFQRTPVIVFTNAYVPNMIHESFQAGATQVFNKAALTPRQIIDALHNAIFLSATAPVAPAPKAAPSDQSSPGASGKLAEDPLAEPPFHTAGQPAPVPVGVVAVAAPALQTASATAAATAAAATAVLMPDSGAQADEEFQAELQQTFVEAAPENLKALRRALQDFSKTQDDETRMPHLLELYRKVHSLTGSAGIAGWQNISQTAAALEVLLKELYEKPKNINASTLRTVAHAIDFMGELFTKSATTDLLATPPINILVVDDEILSRRAITYALEKANLKSVSVEDPQVALNLAGENMFDLIFLDVQMPGMDGFELCKKIKEQTNNKATPVIFVTSLTDFKSRAKSSLSGGTDLIAKPFMFIELSVKALTYVLRGRAAKAQK
jgi:DNA-binding response OmpR family regulator